MNRLKLDRIHEICNRPDTLKIGSYKLGFINGSKLI